jgi:hypothetical protein
LGSPCSSSRAFAPVLPHSTHAYGLAVTTQITILVPNLGLAQLQFVLVTVQE